MTEDHVEEKGYYRLCYGVVQLHLIERSETHTRPYNEEYRARQNL
jgi:hypothetical protein